jgi:hypothetical protein
MGRGRDDDDEYCSARPPGTAAGPVIDAREHGRKHA